MPFLTVMRSLSVALRPIRTAPSICARMPFMLITRPGSTTVTTRSTRMLPVLDRDLGDLSKISGLGEEARDTATTIGAEGLTPAGLLRGEVEHVDHTRGIGERAIEVGPGCDGVGGGLLQQAAAEEVGILSGEVSEFVDEALDRENVEGDLDPAPGSSGSAAFDRHIRHTEVLGRDRVGRWLPRVRRPAPASDHFGR